MLALADRYVVEPGLARGWWLVDSYNLARPLPTVPVKEYAPRPDRRSRWFADKGEADSEATRRNAH